MRAIRSRETDAAPARTHGLDPSILAGNAAIAGETNGLLVISGNISESSSGSVLTVGQAGVTILSGSNSFSGGLVENQQPAGTTAGDLLGQLDINSPWALGLGTLTIDKGNINNTSGTTTIVNA